MGLDPSILQHANFSRRMTGQQRKEYGVKTPEESAAVGIAKSEKQLQNQLYALLCRRGHKPRMQRMDRKSNIALGMPDIAFEFYGASVLWEVKMPGKNPEPHQQKVHDELRAEPNCAIVRVIRSYAEGLHHIEEMTLARKPAKEQHLRQIDAGAGV